jgi:hypothetical protein
MGVLAGVLSSAREARAEGSSAGCDDAAGITFLPSPITPWKGAPLRVLFIAEKALDGELSLIGPDGHVAVRSRERHGGPPYFWFVEVASPMTGTWRATLVRQRTPVGCGAITHHIAVRGDRPARPGTMPGSVWPVRGEWNRTTENMFSAWIEKLFDDAMEAAPSWPALHEVMRDPTRNVLFNHLGLGEDTMKMVLRPDCADLPYFLRGYFAFKLGLPFGYSKCTRGGGGRAPRCSEWWNIQKEEPPPALLDQDPGMQVAAAAGATAPHGLFDLFRQHGPQPPPMAAPSNGFAAKPRGLAGAFGAYMHTVAGGVHSGSGRTALNDNNTDYYPVALTPETLRPGTIYADPYGHILMIVRRLAQTDGEAGVILAVDGQPDGTVARKRFWRGNFLFAQDFALGGPGFKRFRPIVRDRAGGLRRLNNEEIAKHLQYGDFSLDQSQLATEDFYDRMEDVMSPSPLDPLRAMIEAITSLEEQVKTRVISVENGRKWQNGARGEASMPDGAAIFETTGAWEDFSTPSRDLRLLIAMDVVRGFPDRVGRRPERYAMPKDKGVEQVKAELQNMLVSELTARKFSYVRSDGSSWTLALKDVLDRAVALEIAYNPNDCVELRWGAPAQSEEAATCKRQASPAQRAKMAKYRDWFHERRRPPRG